MVFKSLGIRFNNPEAAGLIDTGLRQAIQISVLNAHLDALPLGTRGCVASVDGASCAASA